MNRLGIVLLVLILTLSAACASPPVPTPLLPPTATPAAATATTAGPAAAAPSSAPAFDVEGHRGTRGLRPENTLPAFETALDLGVTTLELDLHWSADDEIVIWHDDGIPAAKCRLDPASTVDAPDPDRAPPASLRIRQLTLAQLRSYRCDRNPDPGRFPDQKPDPTTLAGDDYGLHTLAELFDFVAAYADSPHKSEAQRANARRVFFNIETKRKPNDPAAIGDGFDGVQPGPFEQAIVALVSARGLTGRVIVQSFDFRSLWAVAQLAPTLRLAALTSRPLAPAAVVDLAARGASILSPRSTLVTPALIEQAHAAGLLVIPWTVDDPQAMRRLIEMGVDGLISDRPDWVLAAITD